MTILRVQGRFVSIFLMVMLTSLIGIPALAAEKTAVAISEVHSSVDIYQVDTRNEYDIRIRNSYSLNKSYLKTVKQIIVPLPYQNDFEIISQQYSYKSGDNPIGVEDIVQGKYSATIPTSLIHNNKLTIDYHARIVNNSKGIHTWNAIITVPWFSEKQALPKLNVKLTLHNVQGYSRARFISCHSVTQDDCQKYVTFGQDQHSGRLYSWTATNVSFLSVSLARHHMGLTGTDNSPYWLYILLIVGIVSCVIGLLVWSRYATLFAYARPTEKQLSSQFSEYSPQLPAQLTKTELGILEYIQAYGGVYLQEGKGNETQHLMTLGLLISLSPYKAWKVLLLNIFIPFVITCLGVWQYVVSLQDNPGVTQFVVLLYIIATQLINMIGLRRIITLTPRGKDYLRRYNK